MHISHVPFEWLWVCVISNAKDPKGLTDIFIVTGWFLQTCQLTGGGDSRFIQAHPLLSLSFFFSLYAHYYRGQAITAPAWPRFSPTPKSGTLSQLGQCVYACSYSVPLKLSTKWNKSYGPLYHLTGAWRQGQEVRCVSNSLFFLLFIWRYRNTLSAIFWQPSHLKDCRQGRRVITVSK